MGGPIRSALVVLALALALAEATRPQERAAAAAPVAQEEVTALRRRIARLPAAAVDTSVVRAALEAGAAAAVPDVAAAEAPAAARADAAPDVSPRLDDVRVLPDALRLNEVRFVPLEAADEAKARLAVVQEIQRQAVDLGQPPAGGAGQAGPVAVFEGAIRTLALDSAETRRRPRTRPSRSPSTRPTRRWTCGSSRTSLPRG